MGGHTFSYVNSHIISVNFGLLYNDMLHIVDTIITKNAHTIQCNTYVKLSSASYSLAFKLVGMNDSLYVLQINF